MRRRACGSIIVAALTLPHAGQIVRAFRSDSAGRAIPIAEVKSDKRKRLSKGVVSKTIRGLGQPARPVMLADDDYAFVDLHPRSRQSCLKNPSRVVFL